MRAERHEYARHHFRHVIGERLHACAEPEHAGVALNDVLRVDGRRVVTFLLDPRARQRLKLRLQHELIDVSKRSAAERQVNSVAAPAPRQ